MNELYNQWGGRGGSTSSGSWSGGGGTGSNIDGPVSALVWLVFIFPFKLIWWTITGKLFRWMFGTWLGRFVTITIAVLGSYIAIVQFQYSSFETELAEWWYSNPEPNATLYIDEYFDREFVRTLSCRISVRPAGRGHLTHISETCIPQLGNRDSWPRFLVIEPNTVQEGREHLFLWEFYVNNSDNQDGSPDIRRRSTAYHTLAPTENGYVDSEPHVWRSRRALTGLRIEIDPDELMRDQTD